MSIRSIGIFVTGLAVLATTAYFVKKNYFHPKMHSPAASTVTTQAVSSCMHNKKIQSLFQSVEASTKLDSAYSTTLPLLAAAYTHNKAAYNTWRHNMFQAFSLDEDSSSAQIALGL